MPEARTVSSEKELQELGAEYLYSDGTTVRKPVNWNSGGISWDKPGVYTVTGEVNQSVYYFPFSVNRADPSFFQW
ncbi:Ig-like domain-containing protein [Paenibacillus sp. FSL M7-0420]|uniref:Ig-like domain-containing protein n=1 Tax=Paenibacillus sp. FSL M7-0420 TaxID=2921609 RepID=UPI0030F6C50C